MRARRSATSALSTRSAHPARSRQRRKHENRNHRRRPHRWDADAPSDRARPRCLCRQFQGPDTLRDLAAETGAKAVTVKEAARAGTDLVIVTIPMKSIPGLPRDFLAGTPED